MSDFEILDELINNNALAELKQSPHNGKNTLVLRENGNKKQKGYKIEICNVPDETIAIKADVFPPPDTIFQGNKGECKRADFIIIAKTSGKNGKNEKNWIICIEMKSGNNGKSKEIVQQLNGAQCLVAYCRAIGRAFWQAPTFLKEKDYQQRFVSIENIGINKKPTREQSQPKLHDKPENMRLLSAPKNTLQFQKLTGKS